MIRKKWNRRMKAMTIYVNNSKNNKNQKAIINCMKMICYFNAKQQQEIGHNCRKYENS